MVRPFKDGLEYFPLNTDFEEDDKVAIIEAQYGLVGHSLMVRLLCRIYKNGYFYQWTEKEQLLLAKRMGININEVSNIIHDCVKWGFFDADLFGRYQVLTSVGIQKRYLEATNRRSEVRTYKPYMLLDVNDLKRYKNLVLVDENGQSERVYVNHNPRSTQVKTNDNPQIERESKEKEKKKENESKEKEIESNQPPVVEPINYTQLIVDFWDSNGFGFNNVYAKNKLLTWLDEPDFDETGDMILYAMEIACESNKRTGYYVEGILKKWSQAKCKTLADAKAQQEEFKQSFKKQGQRPPISPTHKREDFDLDD